MTSSSKLRVSLVEESTRGTTPTSPTMLLVEADSQSFSANAPKAESANIRTDARIKQMVPMNRDASGGFSADLCYPTVNQGLWTAIRAALNSSETAQQADAVSGASNGIVSGGTTVLRTSGDWTTNFKVGDIVKITNATATADNRYGLVTTVATGTLTLQLADSATWATTDTSVTVTRGARMIDNTATTERPFSFEISWLDLQKMFVATGQSFDTMEMSFAMGQAAKVRFGTVGYDIAGSSMSSSTVGITGATYTAYTELPVFAPTRAIYVVVNGVSYPISSFSMTTQRGMRTRHSTAGGATPDGVVPGNFRCTLRGSAYFDVVTMVSLDTAGTEVPVWVVMEDGGGKAISFSMGTVVFQSAAVQTGGMGQTEMVQFAAEATNNSTRDACLTFQRFE